MVTQIFWTMGAASVHAKKERSKQKQIQAELNESWRQKAHGFTVVMGGSV